MKTFAKVYFPWTAAINIAGFIVNPIAGFITLIVTGMLTIALYAEGAFD